MTPDQLKIQELEKRLMKLERLLTLNGNTLQINATTRIRGVLSADRVRTARSGSYVELTT